MIGYGLALLSAYMATHYAKFRRWGLWGGAIAAALGLICLWQAVGRHYFGPAGTVNFFDMPHWIIQSFAKDQYSSPVYGNLILAALPFIFIFALWLYRQRAPMVITLCLFAAVPAYSCLAHWAKGEERNHWFGYWFGHDMFTPPFEGPDGKFSYDPKLREQMLKDPVKGKLTYPEMARDTIVVRRHRSGPVLPDLYDFLRKFRSSEGQADGPELRPARLSISSPKTRWRMARIWITSGRNTSAASSTTRRSSAGFSNTSPVWPHRQSQTSVDHESQQS